MDRGGGSHGQGREMQSTALQKLCYEATVEAMCMSLLLLFLIMYSSLHRVLIWEGGFTWTGEGVHMDRGGRCSQQPYSRSCVMRS